MGTIASNSIRQMQQKCVPEYTSFVFKMAAEVEGNVECSVASFMDFSAMNPSKFSKDYKNKHVRDNCWLALGKKFNMTAEEAEKKYKSIRSSYGRWLRKLKKVPSGSGRRTYLKIFSLSSCFNSCTESSTVRVVLSSGVSPQPKIYAFCVFVYPFAFIEQH